MPLVGYSDFEIELGKFWGQAPFPLLEIPRPINRWVSI